MERPWHTDLNVFSLTAPGPRSVAEALYVGIQSTLVQRLSNPAQSELELLLQLIQGVQLSQLDSSLPDSRTSVFSNTNNDLRPVDIYRTSNTDLDLQVFQGFT